MKFIVLLLTLSFLSGCSLRKRYYSSSNIYMHKCYKKDGKVFFEFQPILESVYNASGADVNYDTDSTTARISIIKEPKDGIKYKPDIESYIIREGDSTIYWRILLPGSVNKIIVTDPDSLFVEKVNQ